MRGAAPDANAGSCSERGVEAIQCWGSICCWAWNRGRCCWYWAPTGERRLSRCSDTGYGLQARLTKLSLAVDWHLWAKFIKLLQVKVLDLRLKDLTLCRCYPSSVRLLGTLWWSFWFFGGERYGKLLLMYQIWYFRGEEGQRYHARNTAILRLVGSSATLQEGLMHCMPSGYSWARTL